MAWTSTRFYHNPVADSPIGNPPWLWRAVGCAEQSEAHRIVRDCSREMPSGVGTGAIANDALPDGQHILRAVDRQWSVWIAQTHRTEKTLGIGQPWSERKKERWNCRIFNSLWEMYQDYYSGFAPVQGVFDRNYLIINIFVVLVRRAARWMDIWCIYFISNRYRFNYLWGMGP